MKLEDVINHISTINNNDIEITYRTYLQEGVDIFAGACMWLSKEKMLISLDGDSYSLDDEITHYEIGNNDAYGNNTVTIWYESDWVN